MIVPGEIPVYINVIPESYAEINECFPSVEKKIRLSGGSMVLGWQIWRSPFLIEAEFHAVWKSPADELIDITPKGMPISKILFLPTPGTEYNGIQKDNIRQGLEKNELVDHFIALAQAEYRIKNRGERAHQYGEILLSDEEAEIYQAIEVCKNHIGMMLWNKQNIYSSCFCNSNKTYINCHGKMLPAFLEQI